MPGWKRAGEAKASQADSRIDASRTGDATASDMGYANTGVHIGDVNLVTGHPVRTRYREQVQRIAPHELIERDEELGELERFCTAPEYDGKYSWWRADAWAGKSALMSWFVLHPPSRARVLSFFITARLASQSDRTAFVDNLLEQTSAFLGEPLPALLTESTREAHMLGAMRDVAHLCEQRGETLVLLVDGLDEDRGVNFDPDYHSIASLLPISLPPGMRVIVSGRPNPPIPTDVPENHPLRDNKIVRILKHSPSAQVVRVDMQRDLKRLMMGTPAEQDLLGLLTAAGGGLSGADLSELTGWPEWQIDEHLRTVAGRSFAVRSAHWQREDSPDVYLLGHEELQAAAIEYLNGSRLKGYQERLHVWADQYRTRSWPPTTPEYLLRGYYLMLAAVGDVEKMVILCSDLARHDRMLDISGGDAAALAEIANSQEALVSSLVPDLEAMIRLTIYRDHLMNRNEKMPNAVPAVWAALNHLNRAEALVRSMNRQAYEHAVASTWLAQVLISRNETERAVAAIDAIPDTYNRVKAMCNVVPTLCDHGDKDGALRMSDSASVALSGIVDPVLRRHAQLLTLRAFVAVGEIDRAEALIRSGEYLPWINEALATLAAELALMDGRDERALLYADEAESTLFEQSDPNLQRRSALLLVKAFAALGEFDRAEVVARSESSEANLIEALAAMAIAAAPVERFSDRALTYAFEAEGIASGLVADGSRDAALVKLVEALVCLDELEWAENIAFSIAGVAERSEGFAHLVTPLCSRGFFDAARIFAEAIGVVRLRVDALVSVASGLARSDSLETAKEFANSIGDLEIRAEVIINLARYCASDDELRSGALDLANQGEFLARSIAKSERKLDEVIAIIETAIALNELDTAYLVCRDIGDPDTRKSVSFQLVEAIANSGDVERAESLAVATSKRYRENPSIVPVVKALAVAGKFDRAERLALEIRNSGLRGSALSALAEVLAGVADIDGLKRLSGLELGISARRQIAGFLVGAIARDSGIDEALQFAEREGDVDLRGSLMLDIVNIALAAGETDLAEEIARRIESVILRPVALLDVVVELGTLGESDRATQLVQMIEPGRQSQAMAFLVESLAGSGYVENAADLALKISSSEFRDAAVAFVVAAYGRDGDVVRAQKYAEYVSSVERRMRTLVILVKALSSAGRISDASAIANSIQGRISSGNALRILATTTAKDGDVDASERIIESIPGVDLKVRAMLGVAEVVQDEIYRKRVFIRVLSISRWTTCVRPISVLYKSALGLFMGERDQLEKSAPR